MKHDGNTIGSFELFSILYLSRILSFLTYSLSLRGEINTGDRALMAIVFFLFSLILAIPSLLVCDTEKHTGLISEASCISPNFAKLISVLYALFFLWYATISEARFDIFASTLMFSQSDISIFIAILTLCAVYGAYKGIEALGRAGVIFLVFLSVSLIFTVVTISSKFDVLNITPALYNGAGNVLFNGFSSAARTVEPLSMMIVAPHVSGKIKTGYIKWMSLIFATILIEFTLIGGVTGNYGNMQLFQMFTLAVLSGFSIFERLDALLSGLWVLCALIKFAYFIFVAILCIEQGFSIKVKKAPYIICGLLVFGISTAISQRLETFTIIVNSIGIEISTLVFSVLIPLFVFSAYRISKKKTENKKPEGVPC